MARLAKQRGQMGPEKAARSSIAQDSTRSSGLWVVTVFALHTMNILLSNEIHGCSIDDCQRWDRDTETSDVLFFLSAGAQTGL